MKLKKVVVAFMIILLLFVTACSETDEEAGNQTKTTLNTTPTVNPTSTTPVEQTIEPLTYVSPHKEVLNLPASLPTYHPYIDILGVDSDGFGPKSPIFFSDNGENVALPDGVSAYVVDVNFEEDETDTPTVIGLLKDSKMAFMRLDGEIITDFKYKFTEELDSYKGYVVFEKFGEDGMYGVLDIRTGIEVIPPKYTRISLQDGFVYAETGKSKLLISYEDVVLYELASDTFLWTPHMQESNELIGKRPLFNACTREMFYPDLYYDVSLHISEPYQILTTYDYSAEQSIITITNDEGKVLYFAADYESWEVNNEAVCVRFRDNRVIVVTLSAEPIVYENLPPFHFASYINGVLYLSIDDGLTIGVDRSGKELSRNATKPSIRIVGENAVSISLTGTKNYDHHYLINELGRCFLEIHGAASIVQTGRFIAVYDMTTSKKMIYLSDGTLLYEDFYSVDMRLATDNRVVFLPREGEYKILCSDGTILSLPE